jgi:hypothetical protein
MAATTRNQKLKDWVEHWTEILQPVDMLITLSLA